MNVKLSGLVRNFSYTIIANLVALFISMLVTFIVPKAISVEDYGFFQLYLFYASYVGFFHFGWMDGLFLRYGGVYYEDLDKVGIVYFVGTEFRQKGYVSEAVKAYLDYYFDHYEENEIRANIRDANVPSWKTAEKAGFVLEEKRMYKDIDDSEEQLYRFYSIKR